MASKYDYRDPGQDPAYCDGHGRYLGNDPPDREEAEDRPCCLYCGDPLPVDPVHAPYCCHTCAIHAEEDV